MGQRAVDIVSRGGGAAEPRGSAPVGHAHPDRPGVGRGRRRAPSHGPHLPDGGPGCALGALGTQRKSGPRRCRAAAVAASWPAGFLDDLLRGVPHGRRGARDSRHGGSGGGTDPLPPQPRGCRPCLDGGVAPCQLHGPGGPHCRRERTDRIGPAHRRSGAVAGVGLRGSRSVSRSSGSLARWCC